MTGGKSDRFIHFLASARVAQTRVRRTFPPADKPSVPVRLETTQAVRICPPRGDIASKKRFFDGLQIHLLVTASGEPVELLLTPGSFSDVGCLEVFAWDLPPDSTVYADHGYNHTAFEQMAQTDGQIEFLPMRRENMKDLFPPRVRFLERHFRKRIETVESLMERL